MRNKFDKNSSSQGNMSFIMYLIEWKAHKIETILEFFDNL